MLAASARREPIILSLKKSNESQTQIDGVFGGVCHQIFSLTASFDRDSGFSKLHMTRASQLTTVSFTVINWIVQIETKIIVKTDITSVKGM